MFELDWLMPAHEPDEAGAPLSPAELLADIEATRRFIDAEEMRWIFLVADLDAQNLVAMDGYSSTSAFLVHRLGMSWGHATRSVEMARRLHGIPLVFEAATRGEISLDKVHVLVRAQEKHPEVFPEFEELFCEQAKTLTLRELRQTVEYWSQAVGDATHHRPDDVAHFRASRDLDGTLRIEAVYGTEDGEVVLTAVDSVVSDWIHKETDPLDTRPHARMRADALAEICRQFLDSSDRPQVGGERPHLNVHVSLPTLLGETYDLCETESGELLSPDALRRIACDAAVRRIVFGPDGMPLDVGRSTRTIPPAIRAAVVARDRHCAWPGCDRPPRWCDGHHVVHWIDDGVTSVATVMLLCRHHHHLVHDEGFGVRSDGNGGFVFARPDGSVLDRSPP